MYQEVKSSCNGTKFLLSSNPVTLRYCLSSYDHEIAATTPTITPISAERKADSVVNLSSLPGTVWVLRLQVSYL